MHKRPRSTTTRTKELNFDSRHHVNGLFWGPMISWDPHHGEGPLYMCLRPAALGLLPLANVRLSKRQAKEHG